MHFLGAFSRYPFESSAPNPAAEGFHFYQGYGTGILLLKCIGNVLVVLHVNDRFYGFSNKKQPVRNAGLSTLIGILALERKTPRFRWKSRNISGFQNLPIRSERQSKIVSRASVSGW